MSERRSLDVLSDYRDSKYIMQEYWFQVQVNGQDDPHPRPLLMDGWMDVVDKGSYKNSESTKLIDLSKASDTVSCRELILTWTLALVASVKLSKLASYLTLPNSFRLQRLVQPVWLQGGNNRTQEINAIKFQLILFKVYDWKFLTLPVDIEVRFGDCGLRHESRPL